MNNIKCEVLLTKIEHDGRKASQIISSIVNKFREVIPDLKVAFKCIDFNVDVLEVMIEKPLNLLILVLSNDFSNPDIVITISYNQSTIAIHIACNLTYLNWHVQKIFNLFKDFEIQLFICG